MATMEQVLEEIVRRVVREEIAAALTKAREESAPQLMTIDQAATLAQVHHTTIRGWVKDGSLPASRAGERRGIRIKREDLTRRLERGSTKPVLDLDAMADQMLGRKSA